jgi:hypothetical protein
MSTTSDRLLRAAHFRAAGYWASSQLPRPGRYRSICYVTPSAHRPPKSPMRKLGVATRSEAEIACHWHLLPTLTRRG